MTTTYSPAPFVQPQYFDENGNPVSSGNLYTYAAGTLTPQASYVNAEGSALNTNPVILDAAGRCNLYLDNALSYHLVLMDVSNTITYFDEDNITGSANLTDSQIVTALGYTPYNATNPANYISANQTITLSGPVTGSGTTSIATTLTPTGVTAGSYIATNITVNAAGQITAAASNYNPLTTKGDILGFTGSVLTRIPVGTDGQYLTADSTQTEGVTWTTPLGSIITNVSTTSLTRTGASGFVLDPELTVTLEADSHYNVKVVFYGISQPAGVAFQMHYTENNNGWWNFYQTNSGGEGSAGPFGLNGTWPAFVFPGMIMVIECNVGTGSSGGDIGLIWGNTGMGANTATRYSNSSITATKVG